MHKLSSASLRKLLQTCPHFASVYCHGELVDGVRMLREARRLGLELPIVRLDPVDAARFVFGCHPVRALTLLRDHLGMGTLEALKAIGANNPNDAAVALGRSMDMHASARRPKNRLHINPGDRAEGNPL